MDYKKLAKTLKDVRLNLIAESGRLKDNPDPADLDGIADELESIENELETFAPTAARTPEPAFRWDGATPLVGGAHITPRTTPRTNGFIRGRNRTPS